MIDTDWMTDMTAAIERLGTAIRAASLSATETASAFRLSKMDSEERAKYDPFNARALWERPCPTRVYREKRPFRMVQFNQVSKKKVRSGNGRRAKTVQRQ